MNELQLNDAEFALLIAISIFSAGMVVVGGGGGRGKRSKRLLPRRVSPRMAIVPTVDERGWVGHVPIWEL